MSDATCGGAPLDQRSGQTLFGDCTDLYRRAGTEVTHVWPSGRVGRCWARRFLQKIRRDHAKGRIVEGVLETASKPTPDGFGVTEHAGRFYQGLKLLVLDTTKPYRQLFRAETVVAARQRMDVYRGRQEQARGSVD